MYADKETAWTLVRWSFNTFDLFIIRVDLDVLDVGMQAIICEVKD
jgi:hypothetical protein